MVNLVFTPLSQENAVDFQAITDLLLQSGQELAKKGQALAEEKLQLPESGPERDEALEKLGKGAAMGGLLVALLGTGAGRKLTGATLKLGSLAALGTVAYQAYQNWQGKTDQPGAPVSELSGPAAATRSLALLKAMVAAAKADGHIDDAERARIEIALGKLSLHRDSLEFFKTELEKPLSAKEVATGADSPAAAAEIYLISLAVIDARNEQEHAYLQSLASELNLPSELIAELESGAKA
jgi:uncharacterized membrane protein YebE (DUF533 family)